VPRDKLSIEINAECQAVFDVVHDYDRRLRWDCMLSDARLLGGAQRAGRGVRSVCTGRWTTAYFALETEYVSFDPGRVAAVRLTNAPPLFSRFAASIRHQPLGENRSLLIYTYSFGARPVWLASVLEPTMSVMLRRETRARLRALRDYVER